MQDGDLLAQHAANNEQRLDQDGQIREILNELADARLELQLANDPDLEAEVTQGSAQVFSMAMAFDCSNLRWVSSMRSFGLRNVFTCTGR